MCGIAGFVGRGDRDDLARMSEPLGHRGPDGYGEWLDAAAGVYLAVRRLAIVDPAHAAQPLRASDESCVLAYNGEIYNHCELRQQLEGCGARFVTHHSDTEVLLNAYREWGVGLTSRLNGMWAFAIYDATRQQLLLSRDRFGQKPLYYTLQNGTLAFASELTGLLPHRHVRRTLSALSLQKYFAYGFIPSPHSLYEQVFKLPAGCNLLVDTRTLRCSLTRFWDYAVEPADDDRQSIPELAERLRDLVGQAVRRQMQSDVPVGVFLSGGVDSSAISYFAAKHSSRTLDTFSVGFEHPEFDESAAARQAASFIGTHHTLATLSASEAQRVLPDIVSHLDEPIGDGSLICTHLLCETARPRVTVALGGEGADELFGGYDPFRVLNLARWYARVMPRPMHRAVRLVAARLPARAGYMTLDYRLTRLLRGLSHPPSLWNPVWIGALDARELSECFDDPAPIESVYAEAIELWDRSSHLGLLERSMQFYLKLYLQDDILTKVDRAGMINSLEVRSPFLDLDLIDFVRRLPASVLLRGGRTKFLFKEAMRTVLPPWIVDRSKHGFAVPMAQWWRDGWLDTDRLPLPRGINAAFVSRKLRAHRAGTENNAVFLWSLWLLSRTTNARA
jgi:asparagine synthase (glutamine-hydrolysing)